jgi:motility quorum-sensing regulator/GCU-specific mRNA interferase toxin
MTLLKRTPTYDLNSIKKAFHCPENLVMTSSAKRGQIELDFSDHDVVAVIQALATKDFYKSMPPVHEHFVAWQDVYHACFNDINLYIKFQVNANRELIVSFKEK